MRINNKSITRSIGALVFAFGLTACLEADEAGTPEAQVDHQQVQAQAPKAAPAQGQAKQPAVAAQAPKSQPQQKVAPKAGNKPVEDKKAEEIIDPEVKASIPDMISKEDNSRLEAHYKETMKACTEIRTICVDDGNEEAKCVKIEKGCQQAAESLRSGASTRAGLISALKSLVEAVLGVGDSAVSLVRCASRLIGCAFSTLSFHCVPDFVECVIEEAVAK